MGKKSRAMDSEWALVALYAGAIGSPRKPPAEVIATRWLA